MDLLRFITAGSVDDGKSTLIGRLLYDSKSILADQLEAIERATKGRDDGEIDLALLTDGLRSEREQGITIDVAYRYFQTPARKFIIVDAPGHIQYTRNMVTGASNCQLAVVLVDARHGVVEQTRRHSLIASLLGIPHIVVAVNKMDLMGYSQDVFSDICIQYAELAKNLNVPNVTYIPLSALNGDNVVDKSSAMPWYEGPTLLEHLETVEITDVISDEGKEKPGRFPVQYVIRPQTADLPDYRGYAGKITSGTLRKGDSITVLPSGETSTIDAIEIADEHFDEASAPMSVVLHLADDRDISRGDLIVRSDSLPVSSQTVEAMLCWMDTKEFKVGNKYVLQVGTARTRCSVREIAYQLNVNTYEQKEGVDNLVLNDLAKVVLRTAQPVSFDPYTQNRTTGGAILIDETSNVTVGALMLVGEA
ncbi:sulfate adenylyltransferase subunit 1 [Spirosoma utsteinense]|uniref:sulfate adenylyltransferase n=1 Tax=Spirosoma utsteinense TaxID=2585773 RepID=A0ABR6W602_9BACT|nr:GTP-binding protein [Spirosoma utsteinense]MBC3785849.1 sulfate adenylyltransferase subunit 1 [Spirosoma utsteinense]MBC3792021.1 sulfate adenylyltransferase subunit 1 [Spirosoma utsteinense]